MPRESHDEENAPGGARRASSEQPRSARSKHLGIMFHDLVELRVVYRDIFSSCVLDGGGELPRSRCFAKRRREELPAPTRGASPPVVAGRSSDRHIATLAHARHTDRTTAPGTSCRHEDGQKESPWTTKGLPLARSPAHDRSRSARELPQARGGNGHLTGIVSKAPSSWHLVPTAPQGRGAVWSRTSHRPNRTACVDLLERRRVSWGTLDYIAARRRCTRKQEPRFVAVHTVIWPCIWAAYSRQKSEPESGASLTSAGGEEGLEDAVPNLEWDAGTVVAHGHDGRPAGAVDVESNARGGGAGRHAPRW